MLYRFLASRGFMSMLGVLVLTAAAVTGYFTVVAPPKPMRGYCAIMPDTVGLYVGNHVTMLGIPVGSVTSINPEDHGVRVEFTVESAHPLRGAVAATTVSDTLAADRNLAVLSDAKSGTAWDTRTCITKTLTPKSMTRTLTAVTNLADQLNRTPGQAINGGLTALQAATSGTGPAINALITQLGTALKSPDAAIGHIGDLVDSLASLSTSAVLNWPDIKTTLLGYAQVFDQINNDLFAPAIELVDNVRILLPWLNGLTQQYGGPLLGGLDALAPRLRLVAANVGTLSNLITMVPPLLSAFQKSADPATGAPVLGYAPPRIALASADADRICAALNVIAPGRCSGADTGLTDVSLAQAVLGLAGAR